MQRPLVEPDALRLVNQVITTFFEQSIENAANIDPSYERLWKKLYSLIQSGGKRLRPQMTLISYQAFGGEGFEAVAPVAAAQELLHFALLIHDDIIDRDYTRYGVANIAGEYNLTYSPYLASKEDLTHFSHSAAILAGDLMLSGAHQLIASSSLSRELIMLSQQLLSTGVFEVAGGELLDTELSFMPYKKGDALKVATYKTASYSFICPLLTGAVLAGASNSAQRALRDYATALGIAYQLADDLLGVFGDEAKTGKSTVSDIVEGKRTYLVEVALETFSAADKMIFMQAFGNAQATAIEIEAAKQLLETSGARTRTEQQSTQYTDAALQALDSLELPDERSQPLRVFIDKAAKRSS